MISKAGDAVAEQSSLDGELRATAIDQAMTSEL